ncbi:MAG: DUF4143 domain-containing protein [Bifidobacteriaceae bacterium]|jgi:predicted AAA+ superfamily ATPase|nr:DUF4143 domain-containing protein [Bifidobacteriaceae bacterium]
MGYLPRIVDGQLDRLAQILPAIAVEGAKGVGKTASASRVANEVFALDRKATRENVLADPEFVLGGEAPTLIDEWQRAPDTWDVVRTAVDAGAPPGRFLLAGSAAPPSGIDTHSGAGRIVRLVMRPMSLPERGVERPSVSFGALLAGEETDPGGRTAFTTADYVDEIVSSGFPGIRNLPPDARPLLLDGYLDRTVDRDIPDAGGDVRRPEALRNWLAAYGAATATAASEAAITRAATPGWDEPGPSRPAGRSYRELLRRVWVLDPVPAWLPGFAHLKRLGAAPKHHLVDPALAARLVGATAPALIKGDSEAGFPRDGTFLGALFESLATQTVRVLAEAAGARVSHMRTRGGEHEVDLIAQRPDSRVLALEVKLSTSVRPADVAGLNWLERELPGRVVGKVLINAGDRAFRRPDAVQVVPLALLGP